MSPLETLLLSAVGGLCAAIVALWRRNDALAAARLADQQEASRLVFALLQRIAYFRGERAPQTVSTPENPNFVEAKKLATRELNGEIETLLKSYLDSEPPTKPERKKLR